MSLSPRSTSAALWAAAATLALGCGDVAIQAADECQSDDQSRQCVCNSGAFGVQYCVQQSGRRVFGECVCASAPDEGAPDAGVPDSGPPTDCTPGGICDDDDPCTTADTCDDQGLCAGTPRTCDDGVTCTADSCAPDGGCVNDPAACACTESADCDDEDPCTEDRCEDFGCATELDEGALCDDGDPCTEGDACGSEGCAGAPLSCDDGVPCTVDSCEGGGCIHDGAACECTAASDCDDEDGCTVDACALGECAHSPKNCSDGIACTADFCKSPQGQCVWETAPCLVSVQVEPDALTLAPVESATLVAWCDNGPLGVTDCTLTVEWSSSEPTVASVDTGQVLGLAPGTCTITANADGLAGQASVTVSAP